MKIFNLVAEHLGYIVSMALLVATAGYATYREISKNSCNGNCKGCKEECSKAISEE